MGEEGEVNSAIEGACQICAEKIARYRCPACGIQSCSLPCIQTHKERTTCTGKRTRASRTFTPASRLNEEILLDDQLLLDEVSSSIGQSPSLGQGGGSTEGEKASKPQQGPPRRLVELQRRCRERRISLALMPPGMARSKRNRSRVLAGNRILWTIEWIFIDGPTPEFPLYMRLEDLRSFAHTFKYTTALETDDVATAYEKLTSDTPNLGPVSSVHLFLRLEADRPREHRREPIQSQGHSHQGQSFPPNNVDPNQLLPLPTQSFDVSPSRRLWPIHSPQTPLNLLLSTRTVIEFPTIYIYTEGPIK